MTKLYWISPRDVRKNRADAVRAMLDCAGFAKLGVDVTIVTPHVHRPEYPVTKDQVWQQYGVEPTFRIDELPTRYRDEGRATPRAWELNVRLQKTLAGAGYALKLAARSLRRREPTLFVIHCMATGLPFVLLARLPLLRWKCFFMVGGFVRPRRLERFVARNCAGFLAGNEYLRREVAAAYALDRNRVFQQWPYSYLEVLENADGADAWSHLDDGSRLVVYTGKIGYPPFPEVDLIVDAARQLPDVRFVLVGGNGESERVYADQCRALGIENVVWPGFQPLPRLLALVRRADVLVSYYPSSDPLAERSRIPAKFALYRCGGSPIVAADFPGIREVLGDDEGFFVPPDRPDELARTIQHVLANPEEARRKGTAALNKARRNSVTRYCSEALAFMVATPPAGSGAGAAAGAEGATIVRGA